jgi:Secretion system C-terminal sorting domain/Right handed beta helix region
MLQSFPAYNALIAKGLIGIEIFNVKDIQVGDQSAANQLNTFTNIYQGIYSQNSVTRVYNCTFTNMGSIFILQNSGTAILAKGQKNFLYQPSITVGGTGTFMPCTFDNTKRGVEAFNELHVWVVKNTLTKTSQYGLYCHDIRRQTIAVLANTISNFASPFSFTTGIYLTDCYLTKTTIVSNSVLQRNGQPGSQVGTGIKVALVTPGQEPVRTSLNTVERTKTGIWYVNLTDKNKVFADSNSVRITKPNASITTNHYGVRLEGCATVRVRYNSIFRNINPTPAIQQRLRGISFENSSVSLISHNYIQKMGSGIYGWDDCNNSSLVCNTMDRCYAGCNFDGTTGSANIGDQVLDQNGNPAPTGNDWFNSGGFDLDGAISPTINWYWNVPHTNPTVGLIPGSLIPGFAILSTNTDACLLPLFSTPIQSLERNQIAGRPVLNSGTYPNSNQQLYNGSRQAHRQIQKNQNWLNLNTPQDIQFQQFNSTNQTGTIGQFYVFEEMAAIDSVSVLSTTLNPILGNSIAELNLKAVYEIYNRSWLVGQLEFSSADSATLYSIAIQSASDAGDGVYAARVLLNLSVDETNQISNSRTGLITELDSDFEHSIIVFPNPAKEILSVEIVNEIETESYIRITDIQGKTVAIQAVTQAGVIQIDVTALDAGLYFVHLIQQNAIVETKKIEIVR